MSKVLLINDCKFESMVMRDILDEMGYDVEIANEFEAVEKTKYSYPDIVIANLIMKSVLGDELLQKIKNNNRKIRCILSSNNPIQLNDFKDKNVDAVIHTPINRDELSAALKNNIESAELQEIKFKFCPYCGGKLSGDFKFCPDCGHKLI
ncbi:response regulator receiver domain protein [Clostridiales bacterium oral taxon 876 str. F0540]|nr:response regulator receiver domain protein [Clostridiales bacterium oral taxon 876 str. F0540]